MNQDKLKYIMSVVMMTGLLFVMVAISLALFFELHVSMGSNGVRIITVIAGVGLLLLLPSKIYLTLLFMKNKQK